MGTTLTGVALPAPPGKRESPQLLRTFLCIFAFYAYACCPLRHVCRMYHNNRSRFGCHPLMRSSCNRRSAASSPSRRVLVLHGPVHERRF